MGTQRHVQTCTRQNTIHGSIAGCLPDFRYRIPWLFSGFPDSPSTFFKNVLPCIYPLKVRHFSHEKHGVFQSKFWKGGETKKNWETKKGVRFSEKKGIPTFHVRFRNRKGQKWGFWRQISIDFSKICLNQQILSGHLLCLRVKS